MYGGGERTLQRPRAPANRVFPVTRSAANIGVQATQCVRGVGRRVDENDDTTTTAFT